MAELIQRRILYVDADKTSTGLFKHSIECCGHQVDLASTGADGIALHNHSPYNAIAISDQLPDMAGIDLARQLLDHDPDVPITLISKTGNETVIAEALAIGVLNYVSMDTQGHYVEILPNLIAQSLRLGPKLKQTQEAILESDARQTRAARIAKIGHWAWDEIERRSIYGSRELTAIFGLTVEEHHRLAVNLENIIALIHPDDRTRYKDTLLAAEASKSGYEIIMRAQLPDGQIKHLKEIGEAVLNVDGHHIQTVGTTMDITEQVKFDAILADRESQIEQAIQVANMANWIWDDVNNRYQYVSPRMAEIYGETLESFLAGKFLINENLLWAHPDDREHAEKAIEEGDKSLEPYQFEYRIIWRDGSIHTIRDSITPQLDQNGQHIRSIGCTQDITEFVRAQEELLDARNEAESANRLKSEFLAHMSHELRTPLNAIMGFSQVMENQIFGKLGHSKYVEYAGDVNRSGQHLLSVINNILDLSKIEAAEISLEPTTFDIETAINSCMNMISGYDENQSQRFRVELPEKIAKLYADERIFVQIVLNIFSNANKFTPDDGDISIRIEYDEDTSTIIKIKDTGQGIAPEDVSKVLEPFGQAKSHAHLTHEGTGLGLPLSQKLMELHDGTLTLESELGSGTIVTLIFPPERTVFV